MAVTPGAHRTSGLIHVQARKTALLPALLWQLTAALAGRRSPSFIADYGEARRFIVRSAEPFPVQVDGDDRGSADVVEIEVVPRAVRILAPQETERA